MQNGPNVKTFFMRLLMNPPKRHRVSVISRRIKKEEKRRVRLEIGRAQETYLLIMPKTVFTP